jgi:hypothetical protein
MQDIVILPFYFPIPGAGFPAVNALVIQAAETVPVDTGMGIGIPAFMEALEQIPTRGRGRVG